MLSHDKETSGLNTIDKTLIDDNNNRNDKDGGVYIDHTPDRDRTTSFFAQPGILAGKLFLFFFSLSYF